MKRWTKGVMFIVLVCWGLIIAAIAGLLYTPMGLSFSLSVANSFLPSLQYEKSEGALLDGFVLHGVSLDLDGIVFKANRLELDLNSQCLWSKAVCVDTLTSQGVKLVIPDSGEAAASEPMTEKIHLPLPIKADSVDLADVSLDIMGTQILWERFTTALTFEGSLLVIKPTQMDALTVTLPSTSEAETPTSEAESEPDLKSDATDTADTPLVLPDVFIPLDIEIQDLVLNNTTLNLPDTQHIEKARVKGKVGGNDIQVETFEVSAEQGNAWLSGDIALTGEYALDINASTDIQLAPMIGHRFSLTAQGNLADLSLQAMLEGKQRATLKGKVDILDPSFPFDLQLNSDSLQWPIEEGADYYLKNSAITATGSLKDYRVTLKSRAYGKDIPEMRLNTQLSGNLEQVNIAKLNIGTLGGIFSAKANVGWKDRVHWGADLNFNRIQPGMFRKDFEGMLSGKLRTTGYLNNDGAWKVDVPMLNIDGELREQKLTLKGSATVWDASGKGDVGFNTNGLSLYHGNNHVNLEGKYDESLALKIQLAIESLAASLPGAKGSVKGDVSVTGTLDKPLAKAIIKGQQIAWQDQVKVDEFNLRGSVESKEQIFGGLIFDVVGVDVAGTKFSHLALRASGSDTNQNLSLSFKGEPATGNLALKGELKKGEYWKGSLHSTQIDTEVGTWILEKDLPIGYTFPTNQIDIGIFCLLNMKGKVCLDKPLVVGESGHAAFSIRNFNINTLHPLVADSIGSMSGLVNMKAKVDWLPNALPNIDANLAISSGMLGAPGAQNINFAWDSIKANVKLKDEVLTTDMDLDVVQNGIISLSANITDLASDARQMKARLQIKKLYINRLSRLIDEGAILKGLVNSDIHLSGDLLTPTIKGSISLQDLALRSHLVPIIVDNGGLKIDFKGDKGELKGLIQTPDGALNLSGNANWRNLEKWAATLKVSGDRLRVEMPPMVALDVSPNMTMKATPTDIKISGRVDVPWGRIVVEALPSSAVQVSSDVILLNDQLKPIEKKKKSHLNYEAAIGVHIGDDVRLEAFGLSTMLKGLLNVEADPQGPSVIGEINLEDGTYRSFGQDLLIQKGQILFNGVPTEPYLQIQAIRNPDSVQDNVEAGIRVTGSAMNPEVTIFSEPAMPKANALSYLMRGSNLDSDTDSSGMTSMLIGLGLSQSGQLVGQIGEAFGVQDLSLDTSGTGNEEKVEVSGYILPDLQVKYGVGIFDSLPEFTVKYKLMHNLYIEAVSGLDDTIDLLYQFSIK